jgi:DNA-binding MltR family transcriptional regulator
VAKSNPPKRTTVPSTTEDWNAFSEELHKESDRAAAVLGAAFLDALLEDLLRTFFVDDAAETGPLFTPDGPAGAFGARIRLAYGLGLLAREEYQDLRIVQKVRNRFAHELHGLTFSDQSIADQCRSLRLSRIVFPREPDWLSSPRSRYIFVVTLISQSLAGRVVLCEQHRRQLPQWEVNAIGETGGLSVVSSRLT